MLFGFVTPGFSHGSDGELFSGAIRSFALILLGALELSQHDGEADRCHYNCFEIEFSRQEMADFLSVNRCALSKELARMQSDGLIAYNGTHFELKDLKGQDRHMTNIKQTF